MASRLPPHKTSTVKPKFEVHNDDWETDVTYENESTEKSQRYGSASVPGSGRLDHFDLNSVQEKAKLADAATKTTYQSKNPNRGYGGKFGVENVMDKTAVGFAYKTDSSKQPEKNEPTKAISTKTEEASQSEAKPISALQTIKSNQKAPEKPKIEPQQPKPLQKTEATTQQDVTKTPESATGSTPKSANKISGLKNIFENFAKQEQTAQKTTRGSSNSVLNKFKGQKAVVNTEETTNAKTTEDKKEQVLVEKDDKILKEAVTHVQTKDDPPVVLHESGSQVSTASDVEETKIPVESNDAIFLNENQSSLVENDESESQHKHNQSTDSLETSDEGEFNLKHETGDPMNDQHNPQAIVDEDMNFTCVARYSFEANDDDELGLNINDIIKNVRMIDDNWWTGTIGSKSGMFPANFVERIADDNNES